MFSRAHLLLEKELVYLSRENIWGISARPMTDENIFEWCATIHGLQGTAWEGGIFRVYLKFDENYSESPPEICFHTIPFHPNVDMVTGRPCIDLIDDPKRWRPDYRIYSLLLTVQSMLNSPSEERAVNMEAVAMMQNSPKLYEKVVAECVAASMRIQDGQPVGAGGIADTPGHDKHLKSAGRRRKLTKLSFDDYYKTWSAIATSRNRPGDALEYLEKIKGNPSLQEIHLGLTLKEFSDERKEREERHRTLVYGNLPTKKDPSTSRDAQLAKVNQMRKIYLPRRASNGIGLLGVALKFAFEESQRTTNRCPPGPRALALLRWLLPALWLPRRPVDLGKYFASLRKTYGDVVSLTLGGQTVVVINGYQNIEEALCSPKFCFNGRPRIIWTEITGGKGLFSSEGRTWSEQRKATVQLLHKLRYDNFGRCDTAVLEEARALCAGLLSAGSDGVEPQCLLDAALCNVSSVVLLGRRFEASDPFFEALSQLLDDVFLHAGLQNMANYIPLLRYLPGDPYKCHTLQNHARTAVGYMQGVIAERKAHLEQIGYASSDTFLDMYLAKIRECRSEPDSTFTDDQLLMACIDLLAMSIEAPSTTLRWALLLLAQQPAVQSRLHAEVDAVIGCDRAPTYADRERMPYTCAFITELQRYANVVALDLPHCATEDVSFSGYVIKKGTIIIPNLTSIHFDEDLFSEPEQFNPERFMAPDDKGSIKAAAPNSHDHVVPFSMGPRICLGMAIAKIEIFLFLTSILQKLRIEPTGRAVEPARRHGLIDSPAKFTVRFVQHSEA